MAQENRLTGSQVASFTSNGSGQQKIELHKYLQRVTDQRGPRIAVHEFPYRDGAKIEVMGRKPHRTTWDLLFNGPKWLDMLLALVKAIDTDPTGMIVHPLYGQMRVVCHGIDPATVDVANFTDTVTISLVFTEDQVDLGLQEQQGAAAKKQTVDTSAADMVSTAALYVDAATVAAIAALSAAAAAFSTAAYAAASTVTPDPSLGSLLESVNVTTQVAEIALLADSTALDSVAQVYDAVASTEVLYAACLDLSDEVALDTVGFRLYVVQGDTSIAVLAQAEFGARAISVIDLILRLNPQVLDATDIKAGTELTLPL